MDEFRKTNSQLIRIDLLETTIQIIMCLFHNLKPEGIRLIYDSFFLIFTVLNLSQLMSMD